MKSLKLSCEEMLLREGSLSKPEQKLLRILIYKIKLAKGKLKGFSFFYSYDTILEVTLFNFITYTYVEKIKEAKKVKKASRSEGKVFSQEGSEKARSSGMTSILYSSNSRS